MLLERDPGKPSDYPCMLFVATEDFLGMHPPLHQRIDGHHGYRFLFGRVLLMFVVSQHFEREAFMQAALTEQGRWIAHFVERDALPEFQEAERLAKTIDVPDYMMR
jgi:hypothetical protein